MIKTAITLLFLTSLSIVLFSNPIHTPKIKWKFQTQGPIRGGVTMSGENIFFGNSAGIVYCINKNTGAPLWTYKTNGSIAGRPAFFNGTLVVSSRDNFVYALNAITGALTWKFQMQEVTPHPWGWDYYTANPLISNKSVFVGSGDGNLYCFNLGDGKLLWKFKTAGKIRATPLLSAGKLYAPSFDGIVYVLDPISGSLLWKFETEGAALKSEDFGWDRNGINSTPVIADSLMTFGSRDGSLYCVNINTHKVKWKFTYGATWAIASPVIDNNTVFIGWSDNEFFSAVDLMTGKEKWKYKCGSFVFPTAVLDSENVYVGAGNGKLIGFNKATGEVRWEFQVNGPLLSSLSLENDVLYCGSDDGALYAIDESKKPFKAVYAPDKFKNRFDEVALTVDKRIAPYLLDKGYEKLDTTNLYPFLVARIADRVPSVIVFAHEYLPKNLSGVRPGESLLRKYLEAGGRVLWPGQLPNIYKFDGKGNPIGLDNTYANQLLSVDFDLPHEAGNYYSSATQEGLNWGMPVWFLSTSSVAISPGIVPLALDELGRMSAWQKKFNKSSYGGFVYCRLRNWKSSGQRKDLELVQSLAEYGLQ